MSAEPLARPEPWTEEALCAQIAGDLWFPNDGEQGLTAIRICRGTTPEDACPVLSQCLDYAVRNRERTGIWGGLSPHARIKLERVPEGRHNNCMICGGSFVGVQGQIYCNPDCQAEGRRKRDNRRRTKAKEAS